MLLSHAASCTPSDVQNFTYSEGGVASNTQKSSNPLQGGAYLSQPSVVYIPPQQEVISSQLPPPYSPPGSVSNFTYSERGVANTTQKSSNPLQGGAYLSQPSVVHIPPQQGVISSQLPPPYSPQGSVST